MRSLVPVIGFKKYVSFRSNQERFCVFWEIPPGAEGVEGSPAEDDIPALWKEKMEDARCPNYDVCQLIQTASVVPDPQRRQCYLYAYCLPGNKAWSTCKRYIAKNALGFCPDFVLPDSPLSPSEIIDEFDRLSDGDH